MINTPHNVIPVFNVKANFDLADYPKLILTNLSTGSQVGCLFAFELYSPIGVSIHVGSFTPPDAIDSWRTYTFLEDLPTLGESFDFGNYRLVCKVKVGTEVYTFEKSITIARPHGNKGNNSYGIGSLSYMVKCNQGKVMAEDVSDYSYMGSNGRVVQRKLTLVPPANNDRIFYDPIVVSGHKNVYFKIPYNGRNYTLLLDTTVEYDLGDQYTVVTLKYTAQKSFNVVCNIDLANVLMEVAAFSKKVTCAPSANMTDVLKIVEMQSNMIWAIVGKMQPQSDIDVQKYLDRIIELGNFDCNCLYDTHSGIGSEDCGCDSCKILAILSDKASSSGAFYLEINKEAQNDCNKVLLRPILPDIINIIAEFGFQDVITTTTVPATTLPATTVPATTLPATTLPATTTTPRFTAYWGWKSNNAILDDAAIMASVNKDGFPLGSFVTADYRSNNQPMFLWVAIPVTEEAPTSFYSNALSNGPLGDDSTFAEPVITQSMGFYFIISNFKTQATQNKIQFRY